MQELSKPNTKLGDFPPKLRKLGQFIISCGQLMTLKEACEATGINYGTARTHILRSKKKGLDFHRLVDGHVIEKLRNARPEVYKSLQDRAIDGSHPHQKLFAQLTGDFVEKQEIKHDVGLTFVFTAQEIPEDLRQTRDKEKEIEKVIDTTAEQIK